MKPLLNYIDGSSSATDKWKLQEIKEVKKNFVKNCTEASDKTIVIKLKKNGSGNELVPSDTSRFDQWFLKDQDKDKKYHASALEN